MNTAVSNQPPKKSTDTPLVSKGAPWYKKTPMVIASVVGMVLLVFGGLFAYYYSTTIAPYRMLENSLQKIYNGQYFALSLIQNNAETPFVTIKTNKEVENNRGFIMDSRALSQEYGMVLEAIATIDGTYISVDAPALHAEAKKLPTDHSWIEETALYSSVLDILSKQMWFFDDDRDDPLVYNLAYPSADGTVDEDNDNYDPEKEQRMREMLIQNGHKKIVVDGTRYTAFYMGIDKEKMAIELDEWAKEADTDDETETRKRIVKLMKEADGWDGNIVTMYVGPNKTMRFVDLALPQFNQEEITSMREDIVGTVDLDTDIEAQQFMTETVVTHVDGFIDIFTGEPNEDGLVSVGRATLDYSDDPNPLSIPSETAVVQPEVMEEEFMEFMLAFQTYLQENPSAIQQYEQLFSQMSEEE